MEKGTQNKSTLGIASLVLGIISVITNLFWYMTIPTGILAIIFGVKSVKKSGSNCGKAGLVTGIVGIALCVFIYVSLILILLLASL